MALPLPLRLRRPAPAPTVHATTLRAREAHTGPQLRKIRVPRGTMVGHYNLPGAKAGETTSVTAAASVIYGGTATVGQRAKRAPAEPWQSEALKLRREIGEFRFAGDRNARAASQARIFVAEIGDGHDAKPEPVTDGPVFEVTQPTLGNQAVNQQNIRRATQHLGFNGESQLLIRQDPTDDTMVWSAHSVFEITGTEQSMKLDDGLDKYELTGQDLVLRCWWPDPEKAGLPDCPARSVLPVARELKGLTQHTGAQIDSRLAGAGLLALPSGFTVLSGQAATPEEGDDDADMDDFVRALLQAMTAPLQNPDSASSVVPLVIQGPGEEIDKIKHLTFATPFDAQAKDLREENIRRMALGMDSDPAVLLGMSSGNHWSAWLVSEEEVRLVVAPMLATICHALTVGWLHPVLEQLEGIDPSRYVVWFDTSPLELRPDKSADSRTLHGAGLLSDAATLTANGFDPDTDRPGPQETKRRVLLDLLKAKPDLYPVILPELGIELSAAVLEPVPATDEPAPPAAAEPPAEDNDGQDRDIPDTRTDPPPAATDNPGPGAP